LLLLLFISIMIMHDGFFCRCRHFGFFSYYHVIFSLEQP
jgi:hypothetical protein